MDDTKPHANEPTSKTVMTLTMLHPEDLDPSRMSDVDVANHLSTGSFVGIRSSIETSPVADADVDREIADIGGQPGQFATKPPFIERDDA